MSKISKVLQELLEEDKYEKFFNSMLKKYKVKDPSELKGAQKKKFFDEVDSGFKAKNENVNEDIINEASYRATELSKIKPSSTYRASIIVTGGDGGKTKSLGITNKELEQIKKMFKNDAPASGDA